MQSTLECFCSTSRLDANSCVFKTLQVLSIHVHVLCVRVLLMQYYGITCMTSENGSTFDEEQCKLIMSSLHDDVTETDNDKSAELDMNDSWLLYQQLLKLQVVYVFFN